MNNIPKKWLITIGVVLLFAFTNPSLRDFHESQGITKNGKRNINFLVCSVYQIGDSKYFGFLENFVDITKRKEPIYEYLNVDSIRVADSIKASMAADSSRPNDPLGILKPKP